MAETTIYANDDGDLAHDPPLEHESPCLVYYAETFTEPQDETEIGDLYEEAWFAFSCNRFGNTFLTSQRYRHGWGWPKKYTWELCRTPLLFDTTGLGGDIVISAAKIRLWSDQRTMYEDFTIRIQNGQPTRPSDPVVAVDYYTSLYSGNGGSANTVNLVWVEEDDSYRMDIDLTADGISWIQKGIYTKLMMRSLADTQAVADNIGFQYFHAGLHQPALIITYEPGYGTPYYAWVYGTRFFYVDGSGGIRSEEGTLDGSTGKIPYQWQIQGTKLRYADEDGKGRLIEGTLDGSTGKIPYQVQIRLTKFRYSDKDGKGRDFEGS